eukprot:8159718-Heterocapsa_arctica.AAC.1
MPASTENTYTVRFLLLFLTVIAPDVTYAIYFVISFSPPTVKGFEVPVTAIFKDTVDMPSIRHALY